MSLPSTPADLKTELLMIARKHDESVVKHERIAKNGLDAVKQLGVIRAKILDFTDTSPAARVARDFVVSAIDKQAESESKGVAGIQAAILQSKTESARLKRICKNSSLLNCYLAIIREEPPNPQPATKPVKRAGPIPIAPLRGPQGLSISALPITKSR
jgi:hypothetical protein